MMYSAMLLASLLASAHGFAATPTVGNGETFATHMECEEFAFDSELDYCRYPTCGSNEDCLGGLPGNPLQCLCLDPNIFPPSCDQKFCKQVNMPFCVEVLDGAGGIRYEVECS